MGKVRRKKSVESKCGRVSTLAVFLKAKLRADAQLTYRVSLLSDRLTVYGKWRGKCGMAWEKDPKYIKSSIYKNGVKSSSLLRPGKVMASNKLIQKLSLA